MFKLFNKGPKVRVGKQNNEPEKPAAAAVGKKPLKLSGLNAAFKKLNSMDRKQAYTWGAVAVVGVVALLMLASMAGSSAEDDFSGYETRGYDLANMPFSADEAEQYLLASKYPDLKDKKGGLYTKEEKAARQEADAEKEAQAQAKEVSSAASSQASQYVPGRYYGGGKSGSGANTQINRINSANLKSVSGSGVNGSFGPTGDFSNFRSQNKGNDRFTPQTPGKMNARQALFQTAKASRAAAGLKNDKLLNAKKAMMGGDVKGSDAFENNSGAVDLSKAEGLELDTNAPVDSADLSGMDDALNEANDDAADDAANDEKSIWQIIGEELLKGLVDIAKGVASSYINNQIVAAQQSWDAATARMNEDAMAAWQQTQTHTYKGKDYTDYNDFYKAYKNDNRDKWNTYRAQGRSGTPWQNHTSGRSWTEYNACLQHGGGNCEQYKP